MGMEFRPAVIEYLQNGDDLNLKYLSINLPSHQIVEKQRQHNVI